MCEQYFIESTGFILLKVNHQRETVITSKYAMNLYVYDLKVLEC